MIPKEPQVANSTPMATQAMAGDALVDKLDLRTEPERLLLSLIVTHGIITKTTWEGSSAYSSTELSNAMWRLTRRKLVVARPLCCGITYFMLSKFAASTLAIPQTWAKALEGDGKVRAFARLLFFTKYFPDAIRASKEDVAAIIGQSAGGLPMGFFTRKGSSDWLGFVRIDGHMTSVATRSARSLRDDVLRMVAFKGIKALLKQRNFEWFWITARQSRADAVMTQFKTYDVRKAPVTAVVMPELVALIPAKESTY